MELVRNWIWMFLGFVVLQPLCSQEVPKDEPAWAVKMVNYRPFLDLESVKGNYRFDTYKQTGKKFELRNRAAVLQGEVGKKAVRINGLTYALHYAPVERGGKFLIAAFDLTNVLDLVFSAVSHLQPRWLRKVQILAAHDDWGTELDSADMALELTNALAGYGVGTEVLEPDESPEVDQVEAVALLSLRGNRRLRPRELRVSTLAPPGAPSRTTDKQAVHFGNLYDAESLALATLIHSGLVVGAPAKESFAIDGGIRQVPVELFENASGAAVEVEWGPGTEPLHVLKAVTAGLLRFRAYLDQETQRRKRVFEAEKPIVKVDRVSSVFDAERSAIDLQVNLVKTPHLQGELDREKLDVQVFVFTRTEHSAVDLIAAPPPQVRWTGLLADWTPEDPEKLVLSYFLDKGPRGAVQRETFGHIVRLSYDGKYQTVDAQPKGLLNQLWRFSPIFPE